MKYAQDIIIKPIITEKSMSAGADKRYVFMVSKTATKPEIAAAVQELFGVKVAKVNTVNMKRKLRRVRYVAGYTAAWKKAYVTLKADSKTIEFFEGMN